MTIREMVTVFRVSRSAIGRAARKLFPDKMKNGKKTDFNEVEVTLIKKVLECHHNHSDKMLNRSDLYTTLKYIKGGNI
jgi:hypothetical protein